jgi:UDPglucose 6-dehydrogenase
LQDKREAGELIGFAGLSHLGIVSSLSVVEKGFSVLGYDPDAGLCAQLGNGEFPVFEPGLKELSHNNRSSISYTDEIAELGNCSLVYLSLDVPTDDRGQSELDIPEILIGQVLDSVAHGAIVVILSQVPPGFSRRIAEQHRASFAQKAIRFFYQVETLIFGNAVERALHPERYIVGCADPAEALPKGYSDLLEAFGCPILPMRFESAELAKISINLCLASSISITNTLAELCEATNADWSEIAPSLRLDKRIGQYAYLQPGLGIGGGNIERDLVTAYLLGEEMGTDTGVIQAFRHNSKYRRDWVVRKIRQECTGQRSDPVIGVWGLAYKADTQSTKNSPALALMQSLPELSFRVYDPEVNLPNSPVLQNCTTALEASEGVDILVIMTPWEEFSAIPQGFEADNGG